MDVPLLTLGVVLVAAAIIGGGLKTAGNEIPIIKTLPRQILFGLLGVAVILTAARDTLFRRSAIVTTGLARARIEEQSEAFAVKPEHLLLIGGFFTVVLFALFVYAKTAIDDRAVKLLDQALPHEGLGEGESFLALEKTRGEMGHALGLGVKAREAFENMVVVASPLLSSVSAVFITGAG